jgi:cytochrome c-type biogenesis protein CcmH
MKLPERFGFWMKAAEALVLAIAVCFSIGATNPDSRFIDLGHRLMCTCGCAQLLGECNHVGCTESDRMRSELHAAIGGSGGNSSGGGTGGTGGGASGTPPGGMTDQQILNWFTAKYGATVLAAPRTHGFDLVAWIAPFAVFGAALLGTILLIRRWSGLSGVRTQAAAIEVESNDPAERERRERIRRETGIDGGF